MSQSNYRLNEKAVRFIRRNYYSITIAELATRFKCSTHSIWKAAHGETYAWVDEPLASPEESKWDGEYKTLLKKRSNGLTYRQLGKQYNCSEANIHKIVRRAERLQVLGLLN